MPLIWQKHWGSMCRKFRPEGAIQRAARPWTRRRTIPWDARAIAFSLAPPGSAGGSQGEIADFVEISASNPRAEPRG
jgi:hypothetical protein